MAKPGRLLSEPVFDLLHGWRTLLAPRCSDATGHIEPHGGKLVDLMVIDAGKRAALESSATHQHECSDRNACDVELLSVGGFSPLNGFMNQDAYEHVVDKNRWEATHSCSCTHVWSALPAPGAVAVPAVRRVRGPTACMHACPSAKCKPRACTMHAAMLCRLPGSNLLFGLPVVMDTNNDSIKPGSKVTGQPQHSAPPYILTCMPASQTQTNQR